MIQATTSSQQLLTHSSMVTAKTCLRRYQLQYVHNLKPDRESQPLRMGAAFHLGLETLDITGSLWNACDAIRANYADRPDWADPADWAVECETVLRLVTAHNWRWQHDGYEVVATEREFRRPLVNPETGNTSTRWVLAGKIDRIVRLADGRLAVQEYKTTGDDISPESDYWKRLRLDQQISMYVLAARHLGYDVQTVIYDVTRKPSIAPCMIPQRDADGFKIVLDADGNRVMGRGDKPRQTGDAERGWTLQQARETAEQFGDRLTDDIGSRPDFYFQRHEIPRLSADLLEFQNELWQIGEHLAATGKSNRWFRNTAACLHPYKCQFFDVCTSGVDPAAGVPAGFVRMDFPHPELEQTHDRCTA